MWAQLSFKCYYSTPKTFLPYPSCGIPVWSYKRSGGKSDRVKTSYARMQILKNMTRKRNLESEQTYQKVPINLVGLSL
jgi:hypothetical protein